MSGGRHGVTAVLDEGFDVALRAALPWAGVLALCLLPYRLAQVRLVVRLWDLRGDASAHGDYVRGLAAAVVGGAVLAAVGRSLFARACFHALASRAAPSWRELRPRAADLAGCVLVTMVVLAVGTPLAPTVVALPILAATSLLAAAACQDLPRIGVARPLLACGEAFGNAVQGLAVALTCSVAFVIVTLVLVVSVQAALWLAAGALGDVSRWQALLSPSSPHAGAIVLVAAATLVEPFWIGASCVLVRSGRAEESGDDLRATFRRLRERAA